MLVVKSISRLDLSFLSSLLRVIVMFVYSHRLPAVHQRSMDPTFQLVQHQLMLIVIPLFFSNSNSSGYITVTNFTTAIAVTIVTTCGYCHRCGDGHCCCHCHCCHDCPCCHDYHCCHSYNICHYCYDCNNSLNSCITPTGQLTFDCGIVSCFFEVLLANLL